MFKYDKNFKKSKNVRINDSGNQRVNDMIRIPVQVMKQSHFPEAGRSNRRYSIENHQSSRKYARDSSEERERYECPRRRSHKGRSYFNPLLGDNFVDRKLTRTFVYYRPPFDWYNSDRCEILDEYEEILMPERPIYSPQNSDDSVYDRLDGYERHEDHGRGIYRRRKEPIYDSISDNKKRNGLRKKETVTEREYEIEQEENLFAFSDSENRRKNRPKRNQENGSNDVVEDFRELRIDERKRYRGSPKRH